MDARIKAAENNEKTYLTGRRCKHGHLSERYVRSGQCVQCNREKSSTYGKRLRELRKSKFDLGLRVYAVTVHPEDMPVVTELVNALALARSITVC